MPKYEEALDVILSDWFPDFLTKSHHALWKTLGDKTALISSSYIHDIYQQTLASSTQSLKHSDNYHLIKLAAFAKTTSTKNSPEDFVSKALEYFLYNHYYLHVSPPIGNTATKKLGFCDAAMTFFKAIPALDTTDDKNDKEVFEQWEKSNLKTKTNSPSSKKIKLDFPESTPTLKSISGIKKNTPETGNLLLAYHMTQIAICLFEINCIAEKLWKKHNKTWPSQQTNAVIKERKFSIPFIPSARKNTDPIPASPRTNEENHSTPTALSMPKKTSKKTLSLQLNNIHLNDITHTNSPRTPHTPTSSAPDTARIHRELQRNVLTGPSEPSRNQRTLHVSPNEQKLIDQINSNLQDLMINCDWLWTHRDELAEIIYGNTEEASQIKDEKKYDLKMGFFNTIYKAAYDFITNFDFGINTLTTAPTLQVN